MEQLNSLPSNSDFSFSNDIRIWFRVYYSKSKSPKTIVLSIGAAITSTGWPYYYIKRLTTEGYNVVVYDYRGTGNSDWVKNWLWSKPYNLNHMVEDLESIIEKLKLKSCILLGSSMGGMIAQRLAYKRPKLVTKLILVMSTGYYFDPDLKNNHIQLKFQMLKVYLKNLFLPKEKRLVNIAIDFQRLINGKSTSKVNKEEIKAQVLYELKQKRGVNIMAFIQHAKAFRISGSFHQELNKLKLPTLIIHGKIDPVIHYSHSVKLSKTIEKSSLILYQDKGHELNEIFIDDIINWI